MIVSVKGLAAHLLLFLLKICIAEKFNFSARSTELGTPPDIDVCAPIK